MAVYHILVSLQGGHNVSSVRVLPVRCGAMRVDLQGLHTANNPIMSVRVGRIRNNTHSNERCITVPEIPILRTLASNDTSTACNPNFPQRGMIVGRSGRITVNGRLNTLVKYMATLRLRGSSG